MKQYIFLPLLFLSCSLLAQDPVFSLGDQSQLSNNPAFTGTTQKFRFTNAYRNQWPSVSANYITNFTTFEMNLKKFGAVGISYSHDVAGELLTTSITSANYAYGLEFSENTRLRLGVSMGWYRMKIDINKLTFGDMIDPQLGFVYTTQEPLRTGHMDRFDASAGFLFTHNNMYFSYGANHINRPKTGWTSADVRLPIRHSFQAGTSIAFGASGSIDVIAQSHLQNGYHQTTGLLQGKFKHFILGGGYRLNSGIVGRMGVSFEHFKMYYNLDTYSNSAFNGARAHEIAFQVLLHKKEEKNPWSIVNH